MRFVHRWSPSLRALAVCAAVSLAGCHSRNGNPETTPSTHSAKVNQADSTPPAYFQELVARAQRESAHLGDPPKHVALPPSLQNLDYDRYRTIRFRPERSLWRGEPGHFEVQFFHLGLHYLEPLRISVLDGDKLTPLQFERDMFAYDGVEAPPQDAELGFAGFRIHTTLNRDDYRDEVLVVQGASYFRTLGRGQVYGLSGRALAIDTGEPEPEEFPRFTEVVLVRPGPDDRFMWVLAYLDSPRAVGAYAFRIAPDDTTVMDVTARVFKRGPVKVFGVAPLTSMYLYGEEAPARFGGDHPHLHRPEAHDSDGLLMHAQNGEWLYRPLQNPPRTRVSTFRLDSPRGFGLLQRDRNPDSYRDPEYAYEKRPSAWIEPIGDWGKGQIRLLEISTQLESDDNIGAMWVPDEVPADGLSLRYRVHVGDAVPNGAGPAVRALSTQIAEAGPERLRFTVEFAGAPLKQLAQGALEPVVTATGGKVVDTRVEAAGEERSRVIFEVQRDGNQAVDLRAFLRSGQDVLSETWTYLLSPKA